MWWSCSAGSEVLVCGVVVVWMIMLRISQCCRGVSSGVVMWVGGVMLWVVEKWCGIVEFRCGFLELWRGMRDRANHYK